MGDHDTLTSYFNQIPTLNLAIDLVSKNVSLCFLLIDFNEYKCTGNDRNVMNLRCLQTFVPRLATAARLYVEIMILLCSAVNKIACVHAIPLILETFSLSVLFILRVFVIPLGVLYT